MLFSSIGMQRIKSVIPSEPTTPEYSPPNSIFVTPSNEQKDLQDTQTTPGKMLSPGKTLLSTNKFDLVEDDNILSKFTKPIKDFVLSSGVELRNIPKGTKAVNMVGKKQLNTGIDLAGTVNTPITAPYDAKVVEVKKSGFNGGYGKYVLLEHDVDGEKVYTRFSHLNNVKSFEPGQTVSLGTEIGKLGITGNSSGPHLDFEVFKRNEKGKPIFLKTDSLFKNL